MALSSDSITKSYSVYTPPAAAAAAAPVQASFPTSKCLTRTQTPGVINHRTRATSAPNVMHISSGDDIKSVSDSSNKAQSAPDIVASSADNIAIALFKLIKEKKFTERKYHRSTNCTHHKEELIRLLKDSSYSLLNDLESLNLYITESSKNITKDIYKFSRYLDAELDPLSKQTLSIKIFNEEVSTYKKVSEFHRITGTVKQQFITFLQSRFLEPLLINFIQEIRSTPVESNLESQASRIAQEILVKLPGCFATSKIDLCTRGFYNAFHESAERKFKGFGRFLLVQMIMLRFLCPKLIDVKNPLSGKIIRLLQRTVNEYEQKPDDSWLKFTDCLLDQRSLSQS